VSILYLVRHGQAAFGSDDYDRLTPLGVEQCRALARHWVSLGRPPPKVYTGAMRRQRESAQAFHDELARAGRAPDEITTLAGIEEYDHEALLDKHAAACPGAPAFADCWRDRKILQRTLEQALVSWTGPGIAGYPAFAGFRDRCAAALAALMHSVGRGQAAILFGSAGSLGAAMQPVIGLGDRELMRLTMNFYNTGVSTLLFNATQATIESINALAHLERAETLPLITKR
jgi:broad specificity phosphatase PhoE